MGLSHIEWEVLKSLSALEEILARGGGGGGNFGRQSQLWRQFQLER